MDSPEPSIGGSPAKPPAAAAEGAVVGLSELRQRAGFAHAVDRAARGLVALYRGHLLPNRILNDRGRLALAMYALYLHHTPDSTGVGLTVTRLANLCQETGVCSRGRAKAMVLLMQWAGFLEAGRPPHPLGTSGRIRPLVPTQRLIAEQTRRWTNMCGALAIIDPIGSRLLTQLDNPKVFGALVRHLGRRFISGTRLTDAAPAMALFADRDGGLMLAFLLLMSANDGQGSGEVGPFAISISALARGCHVSRAHVLKLVRDAEAENLVYRQPGPDGGVFLAPALRSGIEAFFASAFAMMIAGGREALAEVESPAETGTLPEVLPVPAQRIGDLAPVPCPAAPPQRDPGLRP
ncbi:hypothetical protein V5F77_21195 [Xanthobacter sp. DSM 24535]|uniref:hypothetical protein n=1 Tax=Roseixanthobacter psychrophilus TaxID=3119917 RepID=UPI0037287634